ncbi:uncharacterized protein [Littorina saxatilis]|uniref:uncharacterized protein n=1 Tax=Littorina saxatilis TaxID=31220 RepID=UPI0038B5BA73
MMLPAQASCSEGLREHVFSAMIADDVTLVAKNDRLIVAYGEKLYQQHGHLKQRRTYIKQKLRELARLLILARREHVTHKKNEKETEITDLQSSIDPCKFPSLISAVRKLCGYSSVENSYSNPSLALKLGHALKKCATCLRSLSLIDGNTDLAEKSQDFIHVCCDEWSSYISSAALATLDHNKWNKPHRLPLTEDIRIVTQHLKEERRKCFRELTRCPSTSTWHALAKVSLANVILFNRRRSGEAARMLLSDYSSAKSNEVSQDDVLEALSDLEKKLVHNFQRVEIRGKRGKKVPVLLTVAMTEEMDRLIELREIVGISETNEYVFARPYYESDDHLAGHEALRESVQASGAKEPGYITGTRLRKHLATCCQILNLSQNELEQVCGYMGHDLIVHRDFYRLPEDSYQLAKVSRLLLCMEQGRLSEFQGKTMNDIDIDPEFSDSEVEVVNSPENVVDSVQADTFEPPSEATGNEGKRKKNHTTKTQKEMTASKRDHRVPNRREETKAMEQE